jgi:hypothetical protein
VKDHFPPHVINALLIGSLGSCLAMSFFWILTERIISSFCIGSLPFLLSLISIMRSHRVHRTDDDIDDRDDLEV